MATNAPLSFKSTNNTNGVLNLSTNLNLTNVILIAKFDYKSKEPNELDLHKNERLILIDNSKNWWLVKRFDSDQTGYIPSNYVKKEKKSLLDKIIPRKLHSKTTNSNAATTEILKTTQNQCDKQQQQSNQTQSIVCLSNAIVKHKYTANKVDELTLNVGASVKVLEKFGDGWWKVSFQKENETILSVGLYPSNYLLEETVGEMNNSSSNELLNPTESQTLTNAPSWQNSNSSFQNNCQSPKNNNMDNSNLNDHSNAKCESISSNEKEIEYVRVIYQFRATKLAPNEQNNHLNNQLNVSFNEILKLLEDDNECLDYDKSWIKVFNSQGITGYIPSNCVEPILDHQLSNFVFIRRPTTVGMFANSHWYFGNITRFETIVLLNKYASNGDYLVRDSDNGNFSLSLKSENTNNKHFKIFFKENKFTIGKKIFYTMQELIDHYHKNPIYDQMGEKLFLIKAFEPPPLNNELFV